MPLQVPLWRMLSIRYQRAPFSGDGARLHGDRWNDRSTVTFYCETHPVTASPTILEPAAARDAVPLPDRGPSRLMEGEDRDEWRDSPSWSPDADRRWCQGRLGPLRLNAGGTAVVLRR